MIPIHDLNPTRRWPFLTWAIILLNVLVFVWELGFSDSQLFTTFQQIAVVPALFAPQPFSAESLLDVLRSMFLHGGWAHLGGNMLYLYLFGDNLEDRFGRIPYLLLYLASGFIAVLAQVIISPSSEIPLVGASGAIAGVLGGYLVLFPGARVRGIIPIGFFTRMAEWPAWVVLGMWFVLQLLSGFSSLGGVESGGVAFFAHIGGFVCGALLTFLLMNVIPQPPAEERLDLIYDKARRYRY
jgi:membrane associated rhomboid family serine protease